MTHAGNGGIPARRAVIRWAWRLFRREWRQQALVLALLAVAVAAAALAGSAGVHVTPLQEARFGAAKQLFTVHRSDAGGPDARVSAAREWFGTVDVIRHWYTPLPGSVKTVELRSQDPHGPYSAPMLRLLTGRYPTTTGEVAVTDEVARLLKLDVGGRLTLAGRTWNVVGLVENPSGLRMEFVLLAPTQTEQPEAVTVLATAGFAVVAQRRLRQLGMLAAIGATQRHLRLVVLADGAAVGAAAAVVGTATGILLWIPFASVLEPAVGHRIDRLDLPWWMLIVAMLLAVVTATVAAWRPARAAARIPITQALAARRPRSRPAHRSTVAAIVLIAIGVGCLRLVGQTNPMLSKALEISELALIVAGVVATGAGLLFIGPLAIRALAAAGARLPVASRLALRDLARQDARSGTALAAISLALAIPTATAVLVSVAERDTATGNLSDRQLLIAIGTPGGPVAERTPAQVDDLEARVNQYAATLGSPTVIPLDVAVDPSAKPRPSAEGGTLARAPIAVGVPTGSDGDGYVEPSYIATPQLLRYYGAESGATDQRADALTTRPRTDLRLISGDPTGEAAFPLAATAPLRGPGYTSLPTSLLTPAAVARHGWTPVRAGWLIEADRPLTAGQLGAVRDLAVDAGLTVESRDAEAGLLVLRWTAIAAGAVLALTVLAMTIGLIRTESAADLRSLTATGATGRIRRSLTATTAGGLALLGATLGIAVAYLDLAAGAGSQIGHLSRVPVPELVAVAVGVPLVAAAGGWVLAGREPRSLTRIRPD